MEKQHAISLVITKHLYHEWLNAHSKENTSTMGQIAGQNIKWRDLHLYDKSNAISTWFFSRTTTFSGSICALEEKIRSL